MIKDKDKKIKKLKKIRWMMKYYTSLVKNKKWNFNLKKNKKKKKTRTIFFLKG